MTRPDTLETVSSDLTELASVLKTRRLKRGMQTAMQRGQGPVLGLTAAVSASLVSAAAKEEEFDPLAVLVAVDDLSALAELCLPGEAYAASEAHDHEFANAGHTGHAIGAFYLADPFASPYARTHGREHDSHDRSAHSGEHLPAEHAEIHGQHAALGGGQQHHQGHHGRGANQAHHVADHDAHEMRAAADHGDHFLMAGDASHRAGHIAHAPAHSGHNLGPSPNGAGHSDHASHAPDLAGPDVDVISGQEQSHDTGHPAVSAPAPEEPMGAAPTSSQTTNDSHDSAHHHTGFGEFDLTPADDLAAAAIPPVI